MSSKKRSSDAVATDKARRKKLKVSTVTESASNTLLVRPDDVDFPRGGGSTFTPAEYKQIKAKSSKELQQVDVFREADTREIVSKKDRKRKFGSMTESNAPSNGSNVRTSAIRVEHLNYKRIAPAMKLLCQVVSVHPSNLIVSLPNQLWGHIPITCISSQVTATLDAFNLDDHLVKDGEVEDQNGDEDKDAELPPKLTELFQVGQYVRAVVLTVKPSGATEERTPSYLKDGNEKASNRVELSLDPQRVNAGIGKTDLKKGFTLSVSVQSLEDHGYILDIGLPDVRGFLRYEKRNDIIHEERYRLGSILNVIVQEVTDDGRTCLFVADDQLFKSSLLKEVSNVSSVLPGLLVSAIVTAVATDGLVVQLLGFFKGTIDLYHLPSNRMPTDFLLGKKLKARVLYNVAGSNPPQFSLSLQDHVISLGPKVHKRAEEHLFQDSFPIGMILHSARVTRVETERGLVMRVDDDVEGFVHISHVSDEHVPSLPANAGPWKMGSVHEARVIDFHSLDGILQLSLRPSVLSRKFLRVDDVQIGELVKGTVRKLTDSSLFVSINGNVDAMIWPSHYADIMLKQPQKRFKPGATIKCRVLSVNPTRRRILLTAKRTIVESDLPRISSIDQCRVSMVSHGVVCRVLEKSLVVEFYNNVRAIIPLREISEIPIIKLSERFSVGQVIKIRIIGVDRDTPRIIASIRQASDDSFVPFGDVRDVEVGQIVSGTVSEIHKDNVLLILDPSRARALISLRNVANHSGVSAAQLYTSLKSGTKMENLVVVSRNLDKGLAIVANRPSSKSTKLTSRASLDEFSIGAKVVGPVVKYSQHGALIKLPGWITGILHPTDTSDDFEQGCTFPAIGSSVVASVIAIDRGKRRITLSTRQSRLDPASHPTIIDREINCVEDLNVGEKLRGFIKSVAGHGVFVSLGHSVDARVQIKELHDGYVKDWKSGFSANKLVSGCILNVDADKKQVEMSFRSDTSQTSQKPELSLGDLVEGQKIDGRVKKVEDFGIFVTIDGTRLTGLCHKSEISDTQNADISMALKTFREGDAVKAVVLSLDKERRRISLSLRPSYFTRERLELSDAAEVEGETSEDASMRDRIVSMIVPLSRTDKNTRSFDGGVEDDEPMVIDPSRLMVPGPEISEKSAIVPALPLRDGFQWNHGVNIMEDNASLSSSDEYERNQGGKNHKRDEKSGQEGLTGDMHKCRPESVADFERSLLASPNSSYLWIQYMSFRLQLSEIEKAREIGRRALQAISIREEQEKLNVWIALLNLENVHGTDQSLEALLRDAARHCDSKTIHLRMVAIFEQSDKSEKAEEQFKRACKKFGKSSKVWTLFGEHYMRRGHIEESRRLLPRSLQSLEKRKHLKTIMKFAQLEYKLGDPERGKTIFEGIVDSHQKRWDIWSVYIDMEAGQKDIQSIRNLFDRILAQKLTSYKAKSFFKKWLELEHHIGDEDGERVVKEKAIEWTKQAAAP